MVRWELKDIMDKDSVESMMSEIDNKTKDLEGWREKLSSGIDEKDFLEIIRLQEELTNLTSRLGAFATLWQSESTGDSERNSFMLKVSEFLTDVSNRLIFFDIWFKNLDDTNAKRLIDSAERYRYMLDSIRKLKPYTLEEENEKILSIKDLTGSEALTNIYDIITNRFSWHFEDKELTQEEMTQYYRDSDPVLRKRAYEAVLSRYGDEEAVLGEIYKNICNDWRNENIKIRGFSSPLNVRNISNDVPDAAVDSLLASIRENSELMKEYFRLKFKALGIQDPSRTDLYAPRNGHDEEYTFEQAKDIVLDTYKRFSTKMYEEARRIFDDGHVHSEIDKGKRSGAFCYSVQNDVVPYVLLNFTGRRNDVFTLMHEIGHGIHGLLGSKQSRFTFHSTLPLAETASIFGETLLARRMISESDDERKLDLLMENLDKHYASIIRQGYFVEFEKEAHELVEKGSTIDELNNRYMENLREQFDGVMEVPEYFKHEWKYIPHIYHTPFYCYAYSFGNLLVLSLMKKYEDEGEAFIPKLLKILEYGGSASPVQILSEAGFDITRKDFWEGGFQLIREELEELQRLLEG